MTPKKRRTNRGPVKAARKPVLTPNMKVTAAVLVVVLAVAGMVWWANRDGGPAAGVATERLVRPDSHRLSSASDGKVTVVEFLDFECGSCGAAYPAVERLRAEYQDRITYVVRLFPLPGHRNAIPTAKAAQAAANQGKFEAMYQKLFESQATWAGQAADQSAVFEGFARDLGLDVDRYRSDVADAATEAFIEAELADAHAVEVTGTPTFFVNGERFTGQPTYENLKTAVEKALAG